jgi:hypothetical protein
MMTAGLNRLSAVEVKAVDRKGMYHDGGGPEVDSLLPPLSM